MNRDINESGLIKTQEILIEHLTTGNSGGEDFIEVSLNPIINIQENEYINGMEIVFHNSSNGDILSGFLYRENGVYRIYGIRAKLEVFDINTYFADVDNKNFRLFMPEKVKSYDSYASVNDVYRMLSNLSRKSQYSFDNSGNVVSSNSKYTNAGLLNVFDKTKLDSNRVSINGYNKSIPNTFVVLTYLTEIAGREYNVDIFNGTDYLSITITILSNGIINVTNRGCRFNVESNPIVLKLVRYTDKLNSNNKIICLQLRCKNTAQTFDYQVDVYDLTDVNIINIGDYNASNITMNDGSEYFELNKNILFIDNYSLVKTSEGITGAKRIPDNKDLKTIELPDSYYRENTDTLTGIPTGLTGGFNLTVCYAGNDSRAYRYVLTADNGKMFIGFYNGTTIVWKSVFTYSDDKSDFPSHTHPASEINTNENARFVSDNQINLWNSLGLGNNVWTVYNYTINPALESYTINQSLLKKYVLNISASLNLSITPSRIGMVGLNVINNTSNESVNITLYLPSTIAEIISRGILSSSTMIATIPANQCLEIYYMVLNENTILIRTELFEKIVNNNTFTVIGESGTLEV